MLITLLQSLGAVDRKRFLLALDKELRRLQSGLKASAGFKGISKSGLIQVEVEGEDSEVLAELISRTLGRAPNGLAGLESLSILQGLIHDVSRGGLDIDVGLEAPSPLYVTVSPSTLRMQLADGKPVSSHELMEDYCLLPDVRVEVRLAGGNFRRKPVEAYLSDREVERLSNMVRDQLDRVLVLHVIREDLESAMIETGVKRFVADIEPVTLTTHCVICKLGTDVLRFIPRLDPRLKGSVLKPFVPKRITSKYREW